MVKEQTQTTLLGGNTAELREWGWTGKAATPVSLGRLCRLRGWRKASQFLKGGNRPPRLTSCYGKRGSLGPSSARVCISEAEPQECVVLTSPRVAVLQTSFESHPSCLSRLAGVVGRSQTLQVVSGPKERHRALHLERSLWIPQDVEGWREARLSDVEFHFFP